MTRPRAVIFDLDETLYPERRFALSGFAAVATAVSEGDPQARRRAFATLVGALRRGGRAGALQQLCDAEGWAHDRVPALVQTIRCHAPSLRLPRASADTLRRLRAGWRVGVLTNGLSAVQARKVASLGVRELVDAVVFAADVGSGRGKPEPEPFAEIAARLDVAPSRCVFVGDDPVCDIDGARRAGMLTIRVLRGPHARTRPASEADSIVPRIDAVPFIAAHLLGEPEALCA